MTTDDVEVRRRLEAMLIVADEPMSVVNLATAVGAPVAGVRRALAALKADYDGEDAGPVRGFELREVGGGWRIYVRESLDDIVTSFIGDQAPARLSQAALETLAVIAYHQPVTREGVRAIRGVNSDGVIASLREKGLVREVGRDRDHGGAQLWGTTRLFLEHFGLRSLRELPPLEDFAPDEESRRFIRERLSGRSLSSTLEEAAEDVDDERDLLDDYETDVAGEGASDE